MPTVEFWFDFASTYSRLAAARIETAAAAAGVAVIWRPFLLGPIFAAQGWTTSPFVTQPAKGGAMWRDVERQCAALGLPFVRIEGFPRNGLLAARLALVADESGAVAPFARAVFEAEFGAGRDIADRTVLADLLADVGLDPEACFARAASPEIKARLRAAGDEAGTCGLFGAPSFVTADGEMFWGADRLDQALDWAVHGRLCRRTVAPTGETP
ncbi:2-hydroxychromene-2-carboxylate isomerase [Siculibacillus lacustris]|uniref:2-hydroxychromene-2-carboxylate isomerase n=1 Tax=Siculibacillus lacustris TaxID=1549641 RepID=A0A4Q9VMB5_9HYPH|nr:2-hydroxychromene-2-carboxylate isomerase [Siculibacillus lacustris]TBW35835.1 2-hydroxychromene-2-carboxylate isomerase [Siculibacillus lacustris]